MTKRCGKQASDPRFLFYLLECDNLDNFTIYLHCREDVWGNEGIALRIHILGTTCRWVVSFMGRPHYPRLRNRAYPFERGLGGSRSRYGRGGEEINPRSYRELNRGRSSRSLVTVLTELHLTIRRNTLKFVHAMSHQRDAGFHCRVQPDVCRNTFLSNVGVIPTDSKI
jgi:hypothetical protein